MFASSLNYLYSEVMQIHLISVGNRMPSWVETGYREYAKRMPKECELILKEIVPGKRNKNCDVVRIINEEGDRMSSALPTGSHIVALDLGGRFGQPLSYPML